MSNNSNDSDSDNDSNRDDNMNNNNSDSDNDSNRDDNMNNSDSDSDSDSNRDDNMNSVTIDNGLSIETLSLLLQFLPNRKFDDDDNNDIKDSNVCVAYTDKDINVITDTVNRLTKKHNEEDTKKKIAADNRILLQLTNTIIDDDIYHTLLNDGIVRVNSILNNYHCDSLLDHINKLLALTISNNVQTEEKTGYGNVLCREHRWDQYLHGDDPLCYDALKSILGVNDTLGILFNNLFENPDEVEFHELSSLISDKGANTQPIHPDSVISCIGAPLYTIFIALQDIDKDMGATIFLPKTNNAECHNAHKNNHTKDDFLATSEYRQSCLKKGDCCIMDSRTLHCGDANNKSRRILLYFTVRNPLNFYKCIPEIPSGSKWSLDEIKLSDFRK